MPPKKIDAEKILSELAEMRKKIPYLEPSKPRSTHDGRAEARTAEEFEMLAVAEGLEALADDLHAAIERARAKALESALKIYYAAEELAQDPANAHLIPQVQAMREAYERDFGRPIPPKPKDGPKD
jgi:hypothetical protein